MVKAEQTTRLKGAQGSRIWAVILAVFWKGNLPRVALATRCTSTCDECLYWMLDTLLLQPGSLKEGLTRRSTTSREQPVNHHPLFAALRTALLKFSSVSLVVVPYQQGCHTSVVLLSHFHFAAVHFQSYQTPTFLDKAPDTFKPIVIFILPTSPQSDQ